MQLKYVIVNVAFADLAPIVFREDIGHELAVVGLSRESLCSAGFVSVYPDPDGRGKLKATAWGRSQGLRLESDPARDSQILTRLFNDAEVHSQGAEEER